MVVTNADLKQVTEIFKELNGGFAATLDEIAEELGISKEYARQIQNKALKKVIKRLRQMSFTAADIID